MALIGIVDTEIQPLAACRELYKGGRSGHGWLAKKAKEKRGHESPGCQQ